MLADFFPFMIFNNFFFNRAEEAAKKVLHNHLIQSKYYNRKNISKVFTKTVPMKIVLELDVDPMVKFK